MSYPNDLQHQDRVIGDPNQIDAIGSGMRPETADFLNDLAGIGTGAFLDMRQADTPEYEDWRDGNFVADDSGNYVSQEGQTYTDDDLERMHGVLSRQAGNPLISRLFNGPKSDLANYMTWRNQNFDNPKGGGWEDEDGNLYTEQALQGMFGAKFATQPTEESQPNKMVADDQQPELQAQQGSQTGEDPSLGDSLKQAADYAKWRDQNFRRTNDEKWEGTDARTYTDQQLQALYANGQTQSKQAAPTRADIIAYIRQQADAYGIPQAIALGLVNKESHFDQSLSGPAKEVGLCQIHPIHKGEVAVDASGNQFKIDLSKAQADWQYNVRVGLSLLKKAYGFAEKNSPDDAVAATYARYNAQGNWKGYRSLNSNVHDHVYGQWLVRHGQRIYVEGYMDFYRKWGGK